MKDEGSIGTLFDDPEIGTGFKNLREVELSEEFSDVFIDLIF